MIDKEKIPNKLYQEMLFLFGEEKTEQIVNSVGYSYHGLIWKVTDEKFKRKYGIRIIPLFVLIIIGIFLLDIIIQID